MRVYDWRTAFLIALLPVFLPLILVSGLLTQVAFRLGHASRTLIASSREFIADAEAVRLTQNPAALISALRRVEGASTIDTVSAQEESMMIDGDSSGPLATHPAIVERIAAIVRTTGPAALIGAAPRDTRPSAGFTRPERAMLIAEPMVLPTVAQPLGRRFARLLATRNDPERNLFGLTNKDMLILAVAMAGIFAFNGLGFRDSALAATFDIRPLRAMGGTLIQVQKCQLGLARPGSCNPETFDIPFGKQSMTGGTIGSGGPGNQDREPTTYQYPDGTFSNVAPAPTAAARIARDRCFQRERYTVGDRGLRSMSELPSLSGPSIPAMRGRATRSAATVAASAAASRDQALKDYVVDRGQLIAVAHRFFGAPGLAAMQRHYAADDHRVVVAELTRRMADARFMQGLQPVQRAEIELLVAAPDDFITCTAKLGRGAKIEKLVDAG